MWGRYTAWVIESLEVQLVLTGTLLSVAGSHPANQLNFQLGGGFSPPATEYDQH